jgi:hypothetical protein
MQEQIRESRPLRFGKSMLVTNEFLASIKAGENPIYHHPDYVCISRKQYEKLTQQHQQYIEKINDKILNLMGWEENPEYDRALEDLRKKLKELNETTR